MTDGAPAQELDAGALRRSCSVANLGFASTRELAPLEGTVGQSRAHDAIAFGLDAETVGYNIFATGPVGTGKRTSIEAHLREHARGRPAAGDLVYVHNFRDPRRPIAISLPSGQGQALASDMRTFLEDARRDLGAAFESEAYTRRRRDVVEPLEREQEGSLAELHEEGRAHGIVLELTPTGC
jgi:Lon-like LonC helical domain